MSESNFNKPRVPMPNRVRPFRNTCTHEGTGRTVNRLSCDGQLHTYCAHCTEEIRDG
jgi:hypothetical protein